MYVSEKIHFTTPKDAFYSQISSFIKNRFLQMEICQSEENNLLKIVILQESRMAGTLIFGYHAVKQVE